MTGKPDCFHTQKGKKFCIPMCSSASDCGTGLVQQQGRMRTWRPDDSHPCPGPSPPTPAPAPPSPTPARPQAPRSLCSTLPTSPVSAGRHPNCLRHPVYSEAYDFGNSAAAWTSRRVRVPAPRRSTGTMSRMMGTTRSPLLVATDRAEPQTRLLLALADHFRPHQHH